MAAVDSFDKPTVLIAGGSDKELDYEEWARKILTRASLEAVVLMGATAEKMRGSIEDAKGKLGEGEATPTKIEVVKDLAAALAEAESLAGASSSGASGGSVVVMSPAAASFDQFKNYKERGEKFRELVKGL